MNEINLLQGIKKQFTNKMYYLLSDAVSSKDNRAPKKLSVSDVLKIIIYFLLFTN